MPEKQISINGKIVNCLRLGKKHDLIKRPSKYGRVYKCKICGEEIVE